MRDRLNADPLAAIVALLRPRTVLSKFVSGAGNWAVQYPSYGQPSFALMLEGSCCLSVEFGEPFLIAPGDYVLLPATPGFRMGSDLEALERPTMRIAEATPVGEVRHGVQGDEPAVRLLTLPLLPRLALLVTRGQPIFFAFRSEGNGGGGFHLHFDFAS